MTEEDRTEQYHIEIDTFGHEDVAFKSTSKALLSALHQTFGLRSHRCSPDHDTGGCPATQPAYRVWDEWGRRITYNPKHGGSIQVSDSPRVPDSLAES